MRFFSALMPRETRFFALFNRHAAFIAGTAFGLIGENGSGKSTLLKCMARILRPDRGSIATEGKVSALLELGTGFNPDVVCDGQTHSVGVTLVGAVYDPGRAHAIAQTRAGNAEGTAPREHVDGIAGCIVQAGENRCEETQCR